MKRSEKVYSRAAKLIESGKEDYACYAISKALGLQHWKRSKEASAFDKVFNDSDNLTFYSFTSTGEVDPEFYFGTELGKSARAIGLLLMAELVKENNPVLTD